MMLFVFTVLSLLNYTADSKKIIFEYRINFGAYPVSLLDGLMLLLGILSLRAMGQPKLEGEKTPRALYWVTGMIGLGIVCGTFSGFLNLVDPRDLVLMARNVFNLLLGVVIGYQVIQNPQQAKKVAYILIFAGLCSAVANLFFVREMAEDIAEANKSFDKLRMVTFGGDTGLVTASVLCFGLVAGIRILPKLVTLLLLPFCVTAVYSLPHRAGWVMATLTLLFSMMVLPRVPLGRRISATALVGGLVSVVLLGAVVVYSNATGKNFQSYIGARLSTLMPGHEDESGSQPKAWDSRLGPALYELKMWSSSPIMGLGYGIQQVEDKKLGNPGFGFRHNVWTSQLCEAGLPGFLGFLMPPVICMVVGFRLVKARTDLGTLLIGAMGAAHGCAAFLIAGMSYSINHQRQAIPLGIFCGLVLRARAIQLAMLKSYEGYYEFEEGADPNHWTIEGPMLPHSGGHFA